MHGWKGRTMTSFEEVLEQFEPMISATIRQLNIYRDFEQFRHVARIALWQAWTRYDAERGDFAPYASRSIRGAMLDLLKKENQFETHYVQTEDVYLMNYIDFDERQETISEFPEPLLQILEQLSAEENALLNALYIEGFSQNEYAEKIGVSIAALKKRRDRLMKKIRERLVE